MIRSFLFTRSAAAYGTYYRNLTPKSPVFWTTEPRLFLQSNLIDSTSALEQRRLEIAHMTRQRRSERAQEKRKAMKTTDLEVKQTRLAEEAGESEGMATRPLIAPTGPPDLRGGAHILSAGDGTHHRRGGTKTTHSWARVSELDETRLAEEAGESEGMATRPLAAPTGPPHLRGGAHILSAGDGTHRHGGTKKARSLARRR
jgi:hypothetical protein